MARKITREERVRYFERNEVNFKTFISWHYLADGTRYHYIHVYRGAEDLPFRSWRWNTDAENNFIGWV